MNSAVCQFLENLYSAHLAQSSIFRKVRRIRRIVQPWVVLRRITSLSSSISGELNYAFFKSTIVAVGINIIFLANALAMTGLDFIKLENGTPQRQALQPIIIQFATNGYKNVPDWPILSIKVREIILKSGYGSQPLERVAEEAAKQLGMSR